MVREQRWDANGWQSDVSWKKKLKKADAPMDGVRIVRADRRMLWRR